MDQASLPRPRCRVSPRQLLRRHPRQLPVPRRPLRSDRQGQSPPMSQAPRPALSPACGRAV